MISYIEGRVLDKTNTYIVVLAHGVGYKIFATEMLIESAVEGEETAVQTYLVVRETAMDLYGFSNPEDLQFFELLIAVSGIGPKSALGILNIADTNTLKTAITNNDSSYLTKVSGIGAKSAKKIVLELQGKIDTIDITEEGPRKDDGDVLEALKALGYNPHEIRSILKDIPSDVTGTNDRIKTALKLLSS